MAEAFYLPADASAGEESDPREWSVERVEATVHTQGSWDPDAQHGGPAAALLTRAMEQGFAGATSGRLTRIGVDILGPMPLGPIVVRRQIVRPGRAVALAEAQLASAGRTVAVGRGWWIRTTDVGTALDADPGVAPGFESPEPPPRSDHDDPVTSWSGGFLAAMRWRFTVGGFDTLGSGAAWARPRYPLVAGERWSPAQACAVLADCGNGLSGQLDSRKYVFINPELTLHLHRLPRGEWVGISAQTSIERDGVGLASSVLFDDDGPIGRGEQALLVAPR